MTATVVQLPKSIQRMVCSGCGAEANASCNCGKPYVPKAMRAAEAIKANPRKSDRAIAADLGIASNTVKAARDELRSTAQLKDGPRIGRDGRTRKTPIRAKQLEMEMPTEEEAEASYQETLYDQACLFLERMTDQTRQRFFAHIRRVYK